MILSISHAYSPSFSLFFLDRHMDISYNEADNPQLKERVHKMSFSLISQLASLYGKLECMDLGQPIETDMPKWPTHESVSVEKTYIHERDHFYCQSVRILEHSGTHVDAPAHMQPHMMENTIDTFPADILIAPAVVYPLYTLNRQAGEVVSADELLAMEKQMGIGVQEGEIALLAFGWDRYWDASDQTQFVGYNMPGLADDAAMLLMDRKVRAVGSDTMCCDGSLKDGKGTNNGIGHSRWLKNKILLIENLRNLTRLPASCFFIGIPLPIKEGSGSPIRPVALFERN